MFPRAFVTFVCFSLTAAVDSGTKRVLREQADTAGAGASLAQCVLPAAPADPSTRPSSFTEYDADPFANYDRPDIFEPGDWPDDRVFTEYDFYVLFGIRYLLRAGLETGPFAGYEPAKLEHCKVDGLEGNPSLKWELHECELSDGALDLHPLTIELRLSDCKGGPLTAAKVKPKPWAGRTQRREKLAAEMQQLTGRPYESGIHGIIGAYSQPLDAPHRGRAVYIANCPLGDDPDLFPVLLRSLCDFTLYDPRPEFQGTFVDERGEVRAPRPDRPPACHGPLKLGAASLTLAELELSAEQLEAALEALRPNQALSLSRVTLTGTPGPRLGELLARKVDQVVGLVTHRGQNLEDELRYSGTIFDEACGELDTFHEALRGGGPSQPEADAIFAAIQDCLNKEYPHHGGSRQYVRWFTGRVADRPEYTTRVVFLVNPDWDDWDDRP